MLAGNEEKLVRRVVSFHTGDAFERDIVSISGVTTCIERIPAPDPRTMRAWVMQLDRYVDVITPPYYTALAGVNDDDGDELHSVRDKTAEMRDEARRADEKREQEELDRLAEEGRRRSGREVAPERGEERAQSRSSFSRVDTGESASRSDARANVRDWDEDGYVRPSERQARYASRNSEERDYSGRTADAGARSTYESTRKPRGEEQPRPEPAQSEPPKPRKRPTPKSTESVINRLGLDGALLCAGIADGSFLRYVLERRAMFGAWRRGWINKRTRAYVADASVSQATVAELQLAQVRMDALKKRDTVSSMKRAQKISQADVIFDSAEGVLEDVGAQGAGSLTDKLLVCDTITPDQVEQLQKLGLKRVVVFTPMPNETYVTTAELEAMLSFVAGREPRYLHITDWEKLLDGAGLKQEMFSLR